ncbi:GntR family transcriptional regulator [Streptococcus parauberis]|nr:GntR family transcriptional regulator [Streptococcus parauberis]
MEKPLVGQKVDQLLDLILERNYETGAKLPNEFELAEDLNVGRSTIREAVRTLVARNILEVKQGSGTFISPKRGVSEDPLVFPY